MIVTGWTTDGGLAISFQEANPPEAFITVEVHKDTGHVRIVGRLPACVCALVVDGYLGPRDWALWRFEGPMSDWELVSTEVSVCWVVNAKDPPQFNRLGELCSECPRQE